LAGVVYPRHIGLRGARRVDDGEFAIVVEEPIIFAILYSLSNDPTGIVDLLRLSAAGAGDIDHGNYAFLVEKAVFYGILIVVGPDDLTSVIDRIDVTICNARNESISVIVPLS
jgi:hypothetical protein